MCPMLLCSDFGFFFFFWGGFYFSFLKEKKIKRISYLSFWCFRVCMCNMWFFFFLMNTRWCFFVFILFCLFTLCLVAKKMVGIRSYYVRVMFCLLMGWVLFDFVY